MTVKLNADEIAEMSDEAVVGLADGSALSILMDTPPNQMAMADFLVIEATDLALFLTRRLARIDQSPAGRPPVHAGV